MAQINYAEKSISCKVVYYGPGVSGKTTNLQIIYEKTPGNNKGNMVSLKTEGDRTLYFDFLPLDLGQIKGFTTKFQLYTVPGQIYYNATRKLVLKGVDAVVFVADSSPKKREENIESLNNLVENLAELNLNVVDDIPLVIQYNKRDLPEVMTVEEMKAELNKWNVPDYEAVAVESIGVFKTLKSVATLFIQGFHEKYGFEVDIEDEKEEPVSTEPPKAESIDIETEKIDIENHRVESVDLDDSDDEKIEIESGSYDSLNITMDKSSNDEEEIEIETTSYSDVEIELSTENETIETNEIESNTTQEETVLEDNSIDNDEDISNSEINFSFQQENNQLVDNQSVDNQAAENSTVTEVDDDILDDIVDDENDADSISQDDDDDLQNDILKAKLELESKKNANVTLKNKTVGAQIKKPTAPSSGNIVNKGNKTLVKRKKKKGLIEKFSSIFKK